MELGKYWKTIVDTLQDGLMVMDPEGNILALNPAAERLTGYSADELVGQNCRILNCTGCELYGRGAGEDWCRLYVKGNVTAKKCLISKKDHRALHVVKNATVLRDSEGQMIGAVETFTDISEMVRQQQEILTLRKSCHLEQDHHGLLGESLPMQRLFELIENVARTDAPVLIHGQSGTGKELVARAIHEDSPRKDRPFIKVNCAALNENLLESELFGHEKGAFTGAYRHRKGRFEAADGGSIFLDEIGDIPPSIQVKLLRVLENKTLIPVGADREVTVDERMLAATNQDLEKLIEAFEAAPTDKPVCFIAYTVKGFGLPLAGHKDNHVGLMTTKQFAEWQAHIGVAQGEEWEPFATVRDLDALKGFLTQVPFFSKGRRRYDDARLAVPAIAPPDDREISTQAAFGKILDALSILEEQGVVEGRTGGEGQRVSDPLAVEMVVARD